MNDRYIPTGVEKALFLLSRNRCYEPQCREPVIRLIKGEPIVNVHIAHICPHSDNGPRCARKMTVEQRRSFHNLILLCKPHHTVVDSKRNERDYPEALLLSWKSQREGHDVSAQLAGLDNITEAKLQAMMAQTVRKTNAGLTRAINELAQISQGAADTLRVLKAETFDRPYLDLDAVASLADSARILRNLEDNVIILHEATSKLGDLEANAVTLESAASKLGNLEFNAVTLHSAAEMLKDLRYNANTLEAAAKEITSGVEQVSSTSWNAPASAGAWLDDSSAPQAESNERWLYFKWGLGVGAFLVVALVVAILIMMHHGH